MGSHASLLESPRLECSDCTTNCDSTAKDGARRVKRLKGIVVATVASGATAVLLLAGVASAVPGIASQIGRYSGAYQVSNTSVDHGVANLVTHSLSGGFNGNTGALSPGAMMVDDVAVRNDGTARASNISITVTGGGKLAADVAVSIGLCGRATADTAATVGECRESVAPLLSSGPLGRRAAVSEKLQAGESFVVMIAARVLRGASQDESGTLSISVNYS